LLGGAIVAKQTSSAGLAKEYHGLLDSVSTLLEEGRSSAARSVNAVLTASYWLIGKRIVEYEQRGQERAAYGLGAQAAVGRSQWPLRAWLLQRNLEQMRLFFLQ
jgi:hypothetical protein